MEIKVAWMTWMSWKFAVPIFREGFAAVYNAHVEQRENASISTQVSKPLQIFSGISFIVLYENIPEISLKHK